MRNNRDAARVILDKLHTDQRSIAWLSRETGITYKTLLRELKHKPDTLRFFHVMIISRVLGIDLQSILGEVAA